jgi:hypothetical protein
LRADQLAVAAALGASDDATALLPAALARAPASVADVDSAILALALCGRHDEWRQLWARVSTESVRACVPLLVVPTLLHLLDFRRSRTSCVCVPCWGMSTAHYPMPLLQCDASSSPPSLPPASSFAPLLPPLWPKQAPTSCTATHATVRAVLTACAASGDMDPLPSVAAALGRLRLQPDEPALTALLQHCDRVEAAWPVGALALATALGGGGDGADMSCGAAPALQALAHARCGRVDTAHAILEEVCVCAHAVLCTWFEMM